ncbi:ROK family protein [Pararhodonellum marinum]|uniref:ROK family protein n=1 Tax=Pararhodonellum marinum TaxID=2755358 RepID=UPI00188F20C4|nr:ROK family protein [Pararhodonellum marinum]
MKNDQVILGMDIGGTSIKAAILKNGELVGKNSILTPAHETQDVILNSIADFIATYDSYQFSAIGIGIPGLVDIRNGVVLNLENIPAFRKVGLKGFLEDRFQKPVYLNNDANCFTLGEFKFGAATNFQHVVGITLGTGIGTGIIANGHLYTGIYCGAGEWGGVPYLDKTFEDYCSSKFFRHFHHTKAKSLAKMAATKDPEAMRIFEEYGRHLGNLIKNLLFILAPEAIVLGGSIRKAYPFFEKSMKETIQTFPYPTLSDGLSILISELDDTAIMGAVALIEEAETYAIIKVNA